MWSVAPSNEVAIDPGGMTKLSWANLNCSVLSCAFCVVRLATVIVYVLPEQLPVEFPLTTVQETPAGSTSVPVTDPEVAEPLFAKV